MDQRIESFLADVLALAGEEPDAVPEGVRRALAKCEAIFRLQEPKKRTTLSTIASRRTGRKLRRCAARMKSGVLHWPIQERGRQSLVASAAMPRVRAWVASGCNLDQPVEVMGPAFRMAGALLGIGKAGVGEA
jgi:hypothetical protein